MASTEKTNKLGLNLWSETDKPERQDFVNDNQKLEELLGSHLQNEALHLTATEKARVKSPYMFFSFQGDGKEKKNWYLSFEPTLVFLFAANELDGGKENGLKSVFQAALFGAYGTPGISVSGAKLTLAQQTEAQAQEAGAGYRLRLNEKGVTYAGVAFQ